MKNNAKFCLMEIKPWIKYCFLPFIEISHFLREWFSWVSLLMFYFEVDEVIERVSFRYKIWMFAVRSQTETERNSAAAGLDSCPLLSSPLSEKGQKTEIILRKLVTAL